MSFVTALRCVECGRDAPDAPDATVCVACGGNLDVQYDYARIAAAGRRGEGDRNAGIWRWMSLLPVAKRPPIPLRVGDTPLVDAPRLAGRLGVASVAIKDDGRNPSAS